MAVLPHCKKKNLKQMQPHPNHSKKSNVCSDYTSIYSALADVIVGEFLVRKPSPILFLHFSGLPEIHGCLYMVFTAQGCLHSDSLRYTFIHKICQQVALQRPSIQRVFVYILYRMEELVFWQNKRRERSLKYPDCPDEVTLWQKQTALHYNQLAENAPPYSSK